MASLSEKDMLPVQAPAGVGNALPVFGQLDFVSKGETIITFGHLLDEQVPAGTVLLDGSVADSIKDPTAIRRELGI